jgi:hydrogenase maturation protein HypF
MKSIPKFQNTKTPRFRSSNLLDPHAILSEVLYLKKQGVSKSEIALYFHNRIISDTFNIVIQIGRMRNINTVCLSGGVFQNRIILDGICSELTHAGFKVFFNRTVPINDGGVSFGQAVIAGQMRSQNLSL